METEEQNWDWAVAPLVKVKRVSAVGSVTFSTKKTPDAV